MLRPKSMIAVTTVMAAICLAAGGVRVPDTGGALAAGGSGGFRVSENAIRWHPSGDYILTNWGIVPLGPRVRVAKTLSYSFFRGNFPSLAGCDWDPKGRRIVIPLKVGISDETVQELFSVSIDDPDLKNFDRKTKIVSAKFGRFNIGPAWEPTGKRIAFLSYKTQAGYAFVNRRLCVVDAQGAKQPKVLIRRGVTGDRPLWSPRGDKLLISVMSNPDDIYSRSVLLIVDATTGHSRRITFGGRKDEELNWDIGYPAWSPDGQSIVFGGDFIYHLRDKSVTRLVSQSPKGEVHSRGHPAWSPDGKRIAYVRVTHDYRPNKLVVVNVRTRQQRAVFKGKDLRWPSWSPDGRWLAFWQGGGPVRPDNLLRVSVEGKRQVEALSKSSYSLGSK